VVQNEKRQGENQPYGQAFLLIFKNVYGETHPYHHTTIGSMNDLNAAKLEDVKNWFRSWYGPNNAVLVLAGDIDLATAKDKVTRYFGDIAPSASLAKLPAQAAPRTTATRAAITDNVPQTRIYKVWNVPPFGTPEADRFELLGQLLGQSQASRLHKRLVFTDKLVDRVSAGLFAQEIGGLFIVTADLKAGVDAAKVEAAIDDEIGKLIAEGPTAAELEQARAVRVADFVRGVERIGGFGGKADVLAECQVYTGNAACYRAALASYQSTTPAQLKDLAGKWLGKGAFTLQIDPGERTPLVEDPAVANLPATTVPPPAKNLKALASTVDRSLGVPTSNEVPALRFPAVTRATLSNGMKVVLAERRGLPIVKLSVEFKGAGYASDHGRKPGTTGFTLRMLEQGAGSYDAQAYAARKNALGAELSTTGSIDGSAVRLSAMKPRLDDSLALLADVVMRPRLDDKDLERVRGQWLAQIKQEKARPSGVAGRLIGPALFGADHPYSIARSGNGTEAGIAALAHDDLTRWLTDWVRPDNATVLVVGDTDLAELIPRLEKAFAGWKAPATAVPRVALPAVKPPARARVLLVDQPGAVQATLLVGQVAPSSTDPAAIELETTNGVLGGEFSSRLNMNLREDKHWSYGSYSQLSDALGQRMWLASAPVQIDKTVESIKEMRREVVEYVAGKAPAKPEELTKIQATNIRTLPGSYETGEAVLETLSDIALYGRSDDYAQRRATKISALTIDDLKKAAATLSPTGMTWVIVGDLKKIEGPIRELGLGDLKVVDADGKVVR
jgi:predicted Zn-dependent peptidase